MAPLAERYTATVCSLTPFSCTTRFAGNMTPAALRTVLAVCIAEGRAFALPAPELPPLAPQGQLAPS